MRLLAAIVTAFLIYFVIILVPQPNTVASQWAEARVAWANEVGRSSRVNNASAKTKLDPDLDRVSNETLGFEKVFSIGLRERTDKRDAMALMAALSGFKVDWIDGVRPDNIPDKAVPFGIDRSKASDNFLGSWRGHMDTIRQ